ncbi:hypothetical protein AK812_SmicGene5639 [Symbiodinium microadriaticum]|uniref:Uncharacterized protein n=1 Tax=Symbiodinium microadriaticum TaxID=2951 RepID=A0A1Q9ET38_SYMMI|nr:hypothetical protein AK812_SmicGene5639 [Symbiodinium microadriaticum]
MRPSAACEEDAHADPLGCAEEEQAGAAPADFGEPKLQDPTLADPAACGEQDAQEQAHADVPPGQQEQADADPPADGIEEK